MISDVSSLAVQRSTAIFREYNYQYCLIIQYPMLDVTAQVYTCPLSTGLQGRKSECRIYLSSILDANKLFKTVMNSENVLILLFVLFSLKEYTEHYWRENIINMGPFMKKYCTYRARMIRSSTYGLLACSSRAKCYIAYASAGDAGAG